MNKFIYLHGFASGPSSKKATEFKKKFNEIEISLEVPDLQGKDFKNMTLTRQMGVLSQCIAKNQNKRTCLIGSSMGAYLAILAAQNRLNIHALYLMAPGFNFLSRWMQRLNLNPDDMDSWQSMISVYHYRYGETRQIDVNLFKDALIWSQCELKRELPIRIVHGIHDEVVPINESREFASDRPWCLLNELNADHSLLTHVDWIINDCLIFFKKFELI